MPLKALVPDVSDIAALASVLKNARARKAFQAALNKGKSPTLSLTAALSASLVSAAAKEEEFDPLAGLVAVDDLSAFGEDCLPGLSYESGDEHDHAALSGSDHGGHFGYSSYLADPFASRFANQYARDHDKHDGHDAQNAITVDHTAHDAAGSHGAEHAAVHSGHQQGHASHQNHDVTASEHHAADSEHASGQHQAPGSTQHSEHSAHDAGHDMSAHKATAHGGHNAPAAVNGHAEHMAPQASLPAAEESYNDHGYAGELENDVIDLDQGIDALAEQNHGAHEIASADDAAAPATSEAPEEHSHHHGVTLADMDAPPADDLAAAQPLPVI
ncbi:hypothetical protein [Hyphococcus sp.]|jgi:hypothetical protein|uniref:hypothetical protein n=1 Tax=Hyphococcus sp. TaxID=2038636 RepID=UPI003D101DC8